MLTEVSADISHQDAERSKGSEKNQGSTISKEEYHRGQIPIGNEQRGKEQIVELQMLQLKQEMMLLSEQSRREMELHVEEKDRKDKTIAALQSGHEILLRQVKSFKPAFEPMDDVTCEMTINEIFRSLQAWCFSHFAERTQRSDIRSTIGKDICCLISSLSLFSLQASEEVLEYSDRLENQIMTISKLPTTHELHILTKFQWTLLKNIFGVLAR